MPGAFDVDTDIRSKVRTPDRAISELAAQRHGVVTRRQLLHIGLSSGAIQRRVERGLLHCVHRGVFAVGHSQLSLRGRWLAAVLACGPGALLSHRSAAALWELATLPAGGIEVSVARRVRGPAGVKLHLSRALETDSASHAGIPVTNPNRTLVDLAAVVDSRRLQRAIEQAERLQLLDVATIERLCTGGRHGTGTLRSILSQYDQSIVWTRSDLERRFLELCASAALPMPLVNAQVAGLEVDMLWREERLVVELDGYAYHRTRAAFERDRHRDIELQLAGYRVLRITARRLETEPGAVIEAIRKLLSADRRWSPDMLR